MRSWTKLAKSSLIAAIALLIWSFFSLPSLAQSKSTAQTKKELQEKKKLAKEFFELTGTKAELKKVVEKLVERQLKSSKLSAFAKMGKSDDKAMQDQFSKEVKDVFQRRLNLVEEINNTLASAYANEFSKAELEALVKYYKSPVGKKALKINSKFSKDISDLKQSILQPKINAALKKAITEETKLKP